MTESLAIIPRTVDEIASLAERLAQSTLIPQAMRDKMPNVLVTIMAGQEMGLPPMAALRSIHVIEGKPVMSADGMVAVVLGSGKAEYFVRTEDSDTRVTYETKRVGDPSPRRCTWTMEMATRAALKTKDNWRAYPRAMLAARAKSELARDVYPDILAACYTEDEIGDFRTAPPPTVHLDATDAEIVSETSVKPLPWWVVEIDQCLTEDALKALAPRLADLKGADKTESRKRYGARLTLIREGGAVQPTEANGATNAEPAPPTEPAA